MLGDGPVQFFSSPFTRAMQTLDGILESFSPEQYGTIVQVSLAWFQKPGSQALTLVCGRTHGYASKSLACSKT